MVVRARRRPAVALAVLLAAAGGSGACGAASPSPVGVGTAQDSPAGPGAAPGGSGGATGPSGATGPLAALTLPVVPATDPWNKPVDRAPRDPASDLLVASIGADGHLHPDFGAGSGTATGGGPFGIPYVVVDGTQEPVPVTFDDAAESDPGPYPIPPDAPVEQGSDAHVLVVDRDRHLLYELYAAHRRADGTWHAGSGAVFGLDTDAPRPAGWTSADAAGLPILPGLVRYDEVAAGRIGHALRFTVSTSRRAYVAPARHAAGSTTSASAPPMGLRLRLRASYDVSGYPPQARTVLAALQTYGMIVADNGSDWYLSGTADPRWDDDQLDTLKDVPGSAFEVVEPGPTTVVGS